MEKFRPGDVKPFEFSTIEQPANTKSSGFKAFQFNQLTGEPFSKEKITDETLKSERSFEKKNSFKIEGVVRESRGLSQQEANEFEQKVAAEVAKRLEDAYEQAYQEGLEKGRIEGKAGAMTDYQLELEKKVNEFADFLDAIRTSSESLLEKNRDDIHEFVKRFTKWILLREVNEKVYLETLLEKLLLEFNARKNLIVKVGRNHFNQMPEVIKTVESRLGHLSNVRVEVVPELTYPGLIIESEHGLIDGSLESVFQNIDKIFEQVNSHD